MLFVEGLAYAVKHLKPSLQALNDDEVLKHITFLSTEFKDAQLMARLSELHSKYVFYRKNEESFVASMWVGSQWQKLKDRFQVLAMNETRLDLPKTYKTKGLR